MRSIRFLVPCASLAVLVSTSLTGCSLYRAADSDALLGFITPYRIEVVQGNVLTKELVEQVQPGQSRAQVRDLLGSPLLTDAFHTDRWDYVFTIRRQGAPAQRHSVVARFDGDQLRSLEGTENLPSEQEFVNSIDNDKKRIRKRALELTPEQIKALPAPAPVASAASDAVGPARSYPPLEPQ